MRRKYRRGRRGRGLSKRVREEDITLARNVDPDIRIKEGEGGSEDGRR